MEIAELRQRAERWQKTDPDPSTAQEIAALLAKDDRQALLERFGTDLEFGTAGLRGIIGAGTNRMNRAVVRRTTAGLSRYLVENIPDVRERGVVVGRDGRHMSEEFAEDTARVLTASGIPALVFSSVVPTPLVSFATLHLRAAAGVMITASHNPPEYNGYKVYWQNGAQIIPPHDRGIADAISQITAPNSIAMALKSEAKSAGLWRDINEDVSRAYLAAILDLRIQRVADPDLSIVYTAMHGVGARWVEEVFGLAGFRQLQSVAEQREPNANFPTVRFPNPEEPGALDLSLAMAERVKADLILANDPDADRLAVVVRDGDGKLQALSGDEVGVLLGHYLLTQGRKVAKPLVITTIVSSGQLKQVARDLGAYFDETLTGFKWVANRALDRAREEGTTFVFGYEEALGYCVGNVTRDKDGISAALVFADLVVWCRRRNIKVLEYLEQIQQRHGLFISKQRSFTYSGPDGVQTIERIMEGFRGLSLDRIGTAKVLATKDYLKGLVKTGTDLEPIAGPRSNVLAYELTGGSRVTLRPSGTEPKIKYYFEHREDVLKNESLASAKERAKRHLLELEEAFLTLAKRF